MDVVAAIVCLSHKYQIESLLAEGLSILTEFYTANFKDWIKTDRPTRLQASALDAVTAIDLGHLTNTPSILPLAYLYASDAGFLAPRDGRVDAVLARAFLDRGDYARIASGRAAFIKASSQALVRIVRPVANCDDHEICGNNITVPASHLDDLLERLFSQPCKIHSWADEFKDSPEESARVVMDDDSDEGSDEFSDEDQDEARDDVADKVPNETSGNGSDNDSETGWEDVSDDSYEGWSVCKECREMVIERELEERKRLWEKLPGMFSVHVDGWSANKS